MLQSELAGWAATEVIVLRKARHFSPEERPALLCLCVYQGCDYPSNNADDSNYAVSEKEWGVLGFGVRMILTFLSLTIPVERPDKQGKILT